MLPEGKCRYIDGQIYPDGNFYVLDTEHIKHNGSELKSALNGINTDISNKVDKVAGKGLSTEDYTTAEKNKLSGIEANANDYVHPTTSGNKHIPSGGSSGKILGWSADGTAAWVDPTGGGGDVSSVKVGSTTYNPDSNGVVSLPAYPTSLPASDVYSWAKASSKPSYTYSEVGAAASSHTHSNYVPTSRKINGYSLSSNITLTYSDVGAAASGHTHSTATQRSNGFFSATDKSKIDAMAWTLYEDFSTTHNWCEFDFSQIPTGTYLLCISAIKSQSEMYSPSLYILSKLLASSYKLVAIATNSKTTISSHSLSNNTLELDFDGQAFHYVSISKIY